MVCSVPVCGAAYHCNVSTEGESDLVQKEVHCCHHRPAFGPGCGILL